MQRSERATERGRERATIVYDRAGIRGVAEARRRRVEAEAAAIMDDGGSAFPSLPLFQHGRFHIVPAVSLGRHGPPQLQKAEKADVGI
jgi:hypothetical protein